MKAVIFKNDISFTINNVSASYLVDDLYWVIERKDKTDCVYDINNYWLEMSDKRCFNHDKTKSLIESIKNR